MFSAFTIRVTFLALFLFTSYCAADTIIDFEPPLPGGLVAVSFVEGTPVTPEARITNQYGNLGILMANVALVDLGLGHAPSGIDGIGGISGTGTVDYGSPVTFTFVDPLNNALPWVTNHFAVSTDLAAGSSNTTTIFGYDITGNLLGSVSHLEGGSVTLELQGIGEIHTVVVESTLISQLEGGIGLDDVQFGSLSAPVPEPQSYALLGTGLAFLWLAARQSKKERAAP